MTKQLDNLITKYIQKNTSDTNTIIINDIWESYNDGEVNITIAYKQKVRDTEIIRDGSTFDNSIYAVKTISLKLIDLNGDF